MLDEDDDSGRAEAQAIMRHAAIHGLKDDAAIVAEIASALSQSDPPLPADPAARERELVARVLLWRRMTGLLLKLGWSGASPPSMPWSW